MKEIIEKAKRAIAQINMTAKEIEQSEAKARAMKELEHIKELYANAYKAARDVVKEKSLQNNGEVKSAEAYNGTVKHSLKDKKWHTDLTKSQLKTVEKWLETAGVSEEKRITDTAFWYMGRLDGESVFVIYSMQDNDGPTILYETKKITARAELEILQKALEVIDNEISTVEKSRIVNEIFGIGDRVQKKHNVADNNDRLGERGSNIGNASILQGKSSEFIGSPAFRNVIRNLFEIQGSKLNGSKKFSLKSEDHKATKNTEALDDVGVQIDEESSSIAPKKNFSLKNTNLTTSVIADILDAAISVESGDTKAITKLEKYVDSGLIPSEKYSELADKYGIIYKGEKPYRDVEVPKKTAKDKKVSQTVRTILESEATPDEALPTIEKMVEDGVFSYDIYTQYR